MNSKERNCSLDDPSAGSWECLSILTIGSCPLNEQKNNSQVIQNAFSSTIHTCILVVQGRSVLPLRLRSSGRLEVAVLAESFSHVLSATSFFNCNVCLGAATKGAHQRIGGAIRREEDIEEGEIRENEDRRGQSLEHEKQRRREEPGRRGLEEACERVGVEVKGEDAEAPTERNEGNGIPRADREKDGVPPRGDGGRDETCEAKNVSDCEREKRVMALEVEAAKLGLVLSNEDTEGKERVSVFRLSIARSRHSGESGGKEMTKKEGRQNRDVL